MKRISILLTATIVLFSVTKLHAITVGEVIFHPANEVIDYNWFSYIPTSINNNTKFYILISGIRAEGSDTEESFYEFYYNEATEVGRSEAERLSSVAEQYKYILIVPVIPRGIIDGLAYYPASFQKEALLSTSPEFVRRPDLRLNLMIDELTSNLIAEGYNIHDKVFLEGFSVGGMFAQRFCLLHPERVQAIAAGSPGGSITIPDSNYIATPTNWPVGVNDFLNLVGYDFNLNGYQKVPQFIYIGDQDINNSTVAVGNHDLFTDEQMTFLNDAFGNSDPVRLENQSEHLRERGCDVEFKVYPGIAHEVTSDMINDIFTFFNRYTDRSPLVIRVPLDFSSIQEAIDAARDGDTILVSDGTFQGSGNKNINFNGKEITVKSVNGPDNCIIDCEGEGRGFVFENGENENSILQGFKIINGQEEFGGGIYINNSSPKIIGCIISENSGVHGAGIAGFNTAAIISSCIIQNNNATGSGVSYFHGSSPTIINSIISQNIAGHGAGLFFFESTGNVINCTITENTASGAGGMYCNSSSPTIVNTIFWGNSPDEFELDNSSPSISYCLIQGGYQGEGNINDDPLFVDPENNDYHLTADSPCIDTGTNSGITTIDYDKEYRPQRLTIDIGADEYNFSDLDEDRDVDGLDLSSYITNPTGVDLAEFASNFGHTAD